ncbi:cupin domain-containing protein [Thermoflexus hugenholtzii]
MESCSSCLEVTPAGLSPSWNTRWCRAHWAHRYTPTATRTNSPTSLKARSHSVTFLVGEELIRASVGSYVFKPRGIPHAFWNASDQPARILEVIVPAGFEKYFEEVTPAFRSDGPPDINHILQTAARYGLQMHLDRLDELAQKYGAPMPGGQTQS